MKKITIFFILIFCLFPINTFAESASSEKCSIEDGPSDTITDYIVNLHIVLRNINAKLIQETPENSIKASYNKGLKTISKGFLSLTSWEYYGSYFKFYVTYSITDDYVSEIRRDYGLLDDESDGLKKYYKYIMKKGYLNSTITKDEICEGVDNCNFSGNIMDVLTQLQGELEYFKDYYRKSILGDNPSFTSGELSFISSDFESEFSSAYNKSTTMECSMGTNGFFNKISEAIDNILTLNESGNNGIQEMKDAIELAKGNSENYAEIEKNLLKKELARQGLDTNQANVLIGNLEKYNSGGISKDNNYFTNSFNTIYKSISTQLSSFKNDVLDTTDEESGKDYIDASNFINNSEENDIEKEISKNIELLYNSEIPYTSLQDTTFSNVLGRLINLHNNINNSVEVLQNTVEISQKVCNSQAKGVGKCEY